MTTCQIMCIKLLIFFIHFLHRTTTKYKVKLIMEKKWQKGEGKTTKLFQSHQLT